MTAQPVVTGVPTMKLHWSPRSPYVRKVMLVAHELGLASRLNCVRTVVPTDDPGHVIFADNPLGAIPTLLDANGQALFDSSVICEYLCMLGDGERLIPRSGPARIATLHRHALGSGLIDTSILWLRERLQPSAASPARVARIGIKVDKTLELLNQQCGAYPADRPDMGHLTIACALSYLDFRFATLTWQGRFPALAAWHQDMEARPSFQDTSFAEG